MARNSPWRKQDMAIIYDLYIEGPPEMEKLTSTLRGLLPATDQIESDALSEQELAVITERGDLRPGEDEAIGYWFARFLSVRDSLWELIEDVLLTVDKPMDHLQEDKDWKLFLVGYAAACLLIRIDRLLLFKIASHTVIQRKLNEAFPEYRIPRKQYTRIFSAYVNRGHALMIYDAIRLVRKNRERLERLRGDPSVGFIMQEIDALESYLDPSKRNYFRRLLSYISHKWRRRGVVSMTKSLARILEGFGRTASEIGSHSNKRVTPALRTEMAELLRPGDVIVTRHDLALTNLFLPGFWPHASLYIGTVEEREQLGVKVDQEKEQRWNGDVCVLEARKDGVLFRPLSDTLAVDNFVVLRPALSDTSIRRGIERAVQHEGKMYNFDFDFFNSERLVCTEVVYRAFDGLDEMHFPLTERAGRKTLSAENLLDFALESGWLAPIAIFGVPGCEDQCVRGDEARALLANSYSGAPSTAAVLGPV